MKVIETQLNINLRPLPKYEHLKFPEIAEIPESNWYAYDLICGHRVYSRVRIRVPRDYSFMEHYVRCAVVKHDHLEWQGIKAMEAVTNEHVQNVSSGSAFVLPNRILRVDGHYSIRSAGLEPNDPKREVIRAHNSGNPFPYSSRDRDY